jgi:thiol reductant ABC exporter CydC subunit
MSKSGERSILREALVRERRNVLIALAASVAVSVSTVALSGSAAWLIVRSAQRPALLSLTFLMGSVQLLALGKAAGRYGERVSTHQAALRVMTEVRAMTARRLEPLVPAGLGVRSADVVETVIGDVDKVQDLLVSVAGPASANLIAGLCAVAVGVFIAPSSALVLLLGILLVGVVLPLAAARSGTRPQNELDAARDCLRHVLDDAAQSGEEYVALGASGTLYRRLESAEDAYDRAARRVARRSAFFAVANALVVGFTMVAIVASTQGAIERHHLALPLLAVPALLALSSLELVGTSSAALLTVQSGRGALKRLNALVAGPSPIHDPLQPEELDESNVVTLEDVSVWRDDVVVLDEVNAVWEPGSYISICGPSGSGKTTLAHLIARFIELHGGDARLGDVELRRLTGVQVRTRVGFVDDSPHVFATTLNANMRLARPSASDDEVLAALHAAGLEPLLLTLPFGLETQLGGAVTGLSGGERRRLGVARALLARRPVLVLDEPSEGLDESEARAMLSEVRRYQRDGVLVVISHHKHDRECATTQLEVKDGHLVDLALPRHGTS